jgi:hypothetical protein
LNVAINGLRLFNVQFRTLEIQPHLQRRTVVEWRREAFQTMLCGFKFFSGPLPLSQVVAV